MIDHKSPAIVWFRNDLRISANPALHAAAKHSAIVPVFIWAPEEESPWQPGGASRWWLHRSLTQLDHALKAKGSFLYVATGSSQDALQSIIEATNAKSIYWNRKYEPATIERDKNIKSHFSKEGLHVESFNGSLLHEPWEVLKKDGTPYQVYGAFWRKASLNVDTSSVGKRIKIPAPPRGFQTQISVDGLDLKPRINWDQGLQEFWKPGEDQAKKLLAKFNGDGIFNYDQQRDVPAESGTSFMSPYLHFGSISPQQIWAAVAKHPRSNPNSQQYLKELVWRDFAAHLLYHFPHTDSAPLRDAFKKFPWKRSKPNLRAWQKGMTGYPIVDAGMRQLWHTGWMHNRVRMIVASFLIKDLQIKWQEGAKWFWDTLVDANLASNTMGWQWTAGCGADAAPYFRVFNPMLQGSRFDPDGTYIRRWIPELNDLPKKWIHSPWEAPDNVLEKANIKLGTTYPGPIVDHFKAKKIALLAYDQIRAKKP